MALRPFLMGAFQTAFGSAKALVRKTVSRNLGVLAAANLASQLCSLAAIPLLTRWCSVSDFGFFQLYATTVTVSGLMACARYDQAILVAPDDKTARAITLLSVGIAAIAAVLVGAGVFFVGPWVGRGWGELGPWSPLVGASVFLTGATTAATQWYVRRANFSAISRTRIVQSLTTVGFQVGAAAGGYGSAALIMGDALGRATGLIALIGLGSLATRMSSSSGTAWRQLARTYSRFPLVSTPSVILNATGFALPVVLLEHFFGAKAVGVFSLLERVMGIPTVLLGQPLSQLFSHRFRSALEEGGAAPIAALKKTAQSAALLGLLPFGALLLAGPFLFSLVFGEAWRHAGELAQLLALPYYVGSVVWPTMPALIILNRLRTQLVWDIVRALLMFAAITFVGLLAAPYQDGIIAAITVMALMYAAHFTLTYRAARSHER
ncbi:MAG: oligosaccharide flippase family protein [Opitutus sp.]